MSASAHNSRSPPRRTRPQSAIPNPFSSEHFSAAAHALQLIDDPNTDVQKTLSSLRTLRDQISASLHSIAPSWNVLTPALASLRNALDATQSASHLRHTLSAIQNDVSIRDDYPSRMASVVHRAAQLSANVALASAVRDFAHLLRAAEIPESLSLSSPQQAKEGTEHSPISRADHASPRLSVLPERFLQRAAALHRARAAASSPPLVHVTALNDIRTTLGRHHSLLQADLEVALIDGIFAPVDHTASEHWNDDEGTHTFAPAIIAKAPSAAGTLPQSIFPMLVQAVDLLGGQNHAALVLRDAASSKLVSLVCEALLIEPAIPPSTIASSPMSAFTTALPIPSQSNRTNPSLPSTRDISTDKVYIFDDQLSSSNRLTCAVIFERVRSNMTIVLRRLSFLAEAVDSDDNRMFDAVHHIWKVMEDIMISFLQALLSFPSPKLSWQSVTEDRQPKSISLLPESSRKAFLLSTDHSSAAWELERTQTSPDSFKALIHNVKTLSPSIYNLEVVNNRLQQFIIMSSRLRNSWRGRRREPAVDTTQVPSTLSQMLARAIDLFLRTVRSDVRLQMKSILGSRSGSLLQPLSQRDRRSSTSPGKSPQGKEASLCSDICDLPLLRQTQKLVVVIASCFSLAIAVPSIAEKIGDVVNHDVIIPFCQRAAYALELVAGWSDGGILYNEMWNAITNREISLDVAAKEANAGKRKECFDIHRTKGGHSDNIVLPRGRILHSIRNETGLSTRVLSHLCEKKPKFVHHVRILQKNEWDAVLRLVTNAKLVISELDSCFIKRESSTTGSLVNVSQSQVTTNRGNEGKFMSLRDLLQMRGVGSNLHGPILDAVRRTQTGSGMLREEVIDRGLILLHCELVLFCFSSVVKVLRDEGPASEGRERLLDFRKQENFVCANKERAGGEWIVTDGKSRNAKEDVQETLKGNCLSRPSSIFKALPIQLSDVERTSDEGSWGMNEFDEFGDRITVTNENANETDIEEFGFPNSLLLEQNDWKCMGEEQDRFVRDSAIMRAKTEETVTKSDRRALDGGRAFGEELKRMDLYVRQCLGGQDRDYVVREADEGVGLGIRLSGEMRAKGDRDVATGARLLMDAAATNAAETLGWPLVESDYSVAEGASNSASECRTLMFAAGML